MLQQTSRDKSGLDFKYDLFISVEFLPVVSVEKLPVYKRLEKI